MKPVIRYRSQLLFRKSYKPERILRFKPAKLDVQFRPVRFGVKPQIKTQTDLPPSPGKSTRTICLRKTF